MKLIVDPPLYNTNEFVLQFHAKITVEKDIK